MANFRNPGPLCPSRHAGDVDDGTSARCTSPRPASTGHRGDRNALRINPQSRSGVPALSVSVAVEQSNMTKILTFSRALTPAEVSVYLFGHPNRSNLLKPVGLIEPGGKAQR